MARKKRYSKRIFAYIRVSSVKKKRKKKKKGKTRGGGGEVGVEMLKRYIYCRSIWRFSPPGDNFFQHL